MISSFKDLRVWQAGIDLVELVYRITGSFPSTELYGLTSQMRRAALSIPSNIAEGHQRHHLREYLQFLSVALGSMAELETQMEVARRLSYVTDETADELVTSVNSLGRQIRKLRATLANRTSAAPTTQHLAPDPGAERQ